MIDLRNTIYFEINAETWNFFKSSLPVQDNDSYWASILTRGEEIVKKYEDTQQAQFAKDQVFTIISELDAFARQVVSIRCDLEQKKLRYRGTDPRKKGKM